MSFICIVCRDVLSKTSQEEDFAVGAAGGYDNSHEIILTKCGHLYHSKCLHDWLIRPAPSQVGCPMCCSEVDFGDCRRVYPIGDEETQELETLSRNMKEAKEEFEKSSLAVHVLEYELSETIEKCAKLEDENNQMKKFLEGILKLQPDLTVDADENCKEMLAKLSIHHFNAIGTETEEQLIV